MKSVIVKEHLDKLVEKMQEYRLHEFSATAIGILKPEATLAIETIKHICSVADELRFQAILDGLGEDIDVECKLYELYVYVNNRDRAFYVSECFRKAMLGNSLIACYIMSLILSDNSKDNKDYSQEDMILMSALEHFTDYDFQNFKEIMQEPYQMELENGIKYIERNNFPQEKKGSYTMTIEYCVQNRIFGKEKNAVGEVLNIYDYVIYPQAYKLLEYMKRVQRLMEFGKTKL